MSNDWSAERILAARRSLFSDPVGLDAFFVERARQRAAMQPRCDFTVNELPTLTIPAASDMIPVWHNGQLYQALISAINAIPSQFQLGYFNVVNYGAVSQTDSTAAIQRAINAALAAGGGIVFFPPGNWITSAPLLTGSGIILQGSGRAATTITWTSVNAPAIHLPSSVGQVGGAIRDLTIATALFPTASAILLGQPNFYDVTNVWINGLIGGTWNTSACITIGETSADTAQNIALRHLFFAAWTNGVDWVAGNGGALYALDVTASGPAGTNSFGYRFAGALTNVETIELIGGGMGHFAYGLVVAQTAGSVQTFFLSDWSSDANSQAAMLLTPSGGTIQRHKYRGCWFAGGVIACQVGAGGMGGIVKDMHFDGCNIIGGTTYGLTIDGGSSFVKLTANKIYENPTQIYVGTASRVTIENNHAQGLYLGAGAGGLNVNGIVLSANATTTVVRNNDLGINTTPLTNSAASPASNVIRNNTGYNPVGALTAPGVPATTVPLSNPFSEDTMILMTTGGAGAGVTVSIGGSAGVLVPPSSAISLTLLAVQSITLTYTTTTVAWTWVGN